MKNIWSIILIGIVLSIASCSENDTPDDENSIGITSLTFDKTSVSLFIDGEETLVVTINPEELSGTKITWNSSDSKVATVTDKGKIKGLKAGTAVITASVGGKSATCNVTVTDKQISNVVLDKTTLSMYTTDRERLTVTITPSVAIDISWSTSDKEVALVSSDGVVKATGAGTAVITASVGGKTAACNITVSPAVFAAGYSSDRVIYLWKNGKKHTLNESISAVIRSMYIYEGDVYLAGYSKSYSYSAVYDRAIILKLTMPVPGEQPHPDDEERYIMETAGRFSWGTGVVVANGVRYACGDDYILQANTTNVYYVRPTVWENEKKQHLTNNTSGERYHASGMFVSGNDVYVVGQVNGIAALWKNGDFQELTCEGTVKIDIYQQSCANAVFVSGSDVYVVGEGSFPPALSTLKMPKTKPVLWKNGVAQILSDDYGYMQSVYVSGSDVYAISYDQLWKNGVEVLTTNDGSDPTLHSVFVYGDDIYIGGKESKTTTRLWKNGMPQVLEEEIWGTIYSVIVK